MGCRSSAGCRLIPGSRPRPTGDAPSSWTTAPPPPGGLLPGSRARSPRASRSHDIPARGGGAGARMTEVLSARLPRPSAERLTADLGVLETCTRRERPYTRRAFSDEDRAARRWLAAEMAAAGLAVTVDAAGNQIGRRAGGRAGPALVIGSHLDTVEAGGRFDGIAGVLAGLEVARCLTAGGHHLEHPL